jgi:hypothetical protein
VFFIGKRMRLYPVNPKPIAKVLKREEFVIPTKVGHAVKHSAIQSFQYVVKISGFSFARE